MAIKTRKVYLSKLRRQPALTPAQEKLEMELTQQLDEAETQIQVLAAGIRNQLKAPHPDYGPLASKIRRLEPMFVQMMRRVHDAELYQDGLRKLHSKRGFC